MKLLSIFSCRGAQEISCKKIKSTRGVHFTILPTNPCAAELYEFDIRGQLTDVTTCVKFLVDRFRGYGVLTPQNCHFPLTCCVALTTVYRSTAVRHCDQFKHRLDKYWKTIILCMITGPLGFYFLIIYLFAQKTTIITVISKRYSFLSFGSKLAIHREN